MTHSKNRNLIGIRHVIHSSRGLLAISHTIHSIFYAWGTYRAILVAPGRRYTLDSGGLSGKTVGSCENARRDPSSKLNFARAHLDSMVSSSTGRDSTPPWGFPVGVMGVETLLRGPGAPDKKAPPPGALEITVTTNTLVAANFENRLIVTMLLCGPRQALEPDRSVSTETWVEGFMVRSLMEIRHYCLYCTGSVCWREIVVTGWSGVR